MLCHGLNISCYNMIVHVEAGTINKVDMVAEEAMKDICTTILVVLPFLFFGMKQHLVLIYEEK